MSLFVVIQMYYLKVNYTSRCFADIRVSLWRFCIVSWTVRCEQRCPGWSEARDYLVSAPDGSQDHPLTLAAHVAAIRRNLADDQSGHVGGKTLGSVFFTIGQLDAPPTRWRVHKVSSLSSPLISSMHISMLFLYAARYVTWAFHFFMHLLVSILLMSLYYNRINLYIICIF